MATAHTCKNASQFIQACLERARKEDIKSSRGQFPETIQKDNKILDIIILSFYTNSDSFSQPTKASVLIWSDVYRHIIELFRERYTPAQYPQVYAKIMLYYVLYSQNMDYQQKEKLVDDIFKYYNIDYITNMYEKKQNWQWIDKHWFEFKSIIYNFLAQYMNFGARRRQLRLLNNDICFEFTINLLELKYLAIVLKNILQYHSQYSISSVVDDSTCACDLCHNYVESISQTYAVLKGLFDQIVVATARNQIGDDDTIINKTSKLMNKFAYLLVNLRRNKIIARCYSLEYALWKFIIQFNVFCKFNNECLFLACKNLSKMGPICANPVDIDGPCRPCREAISGFVMYYFIMNDWCSFKKYLNLREKFTDSYDVWIGMFDQISNNRSLKDYFFNDSLSMEQRWTFVQRKSCIPPPHVFYFDDKIVQTLQNEKYVTILNNIAMFKECNYSECNKKDIRLKRCKNCVSVYYCSRLCQKKDWLNHKRVCKKLNSRDYSINFHR